MCSKCLLALALTASVPRAQAAGLEGWIQSFTQSDFVFARAITNVPFQPLGWLSARNYGGADQLP